MRHLFILMIVLGLSCRNSHSQTSFGWKTVYDVGKEVEFCQLEEMDGAYILGYSFPVYLGGGSNVVHLSSLDSSARSSVLFHDNGTILKFVNVGIDYATFVGFNFAKGMISSSAYLLEKDKTIRKIVTSSALSRRMFDIGGELLLEGDVDGVTEMLSSKDKGESLRRVDVVTSEYKDFEMVVQRGRMLLCAGGRTFDPKEREWFIWNAQAGQIKVVKKIATGASICRVIGKDCLVAECLNGTISILSLNEGSLSLLATFSLPDEIKVVSNVYYTEKFCIVGGKGLFDRNTDVAYISENKGGQWDAFYQGKCRLVYNSFGKLIIINRDNKVQVAL